MITSDHKKKLKKLLKGDYSSDVIALLQAKKIFNKEGKPFSKAMIRSVFNGYVENIAIEEAIFEIYKSRKEAEKLIFEQRQSILAK